MATYYLTISPINTLSTSTYSIYYDSITFSNLIASGVPQSTLVGGLLVYFTGSAGIIRFTVDQALNSVFDLGSYVCVRLTGTTSGPSYDIDLGSGTGYIGTSCGACPAAPTPAPVAVYDYYDYQNCATFDIPFYSIPVLQGNAYPNNIVIDSNCYTPINGTPYASPNYSTPGYTVTSCFCP